jgi:hypothetical protein
MILSISFFQRNKNLQVSTQSREEKKEKLFLKIFDCSFSLVLKLEEIKIHFVKILFSTSTFLLNIILREKNEEES